TFSLTITATATGGRHATASRIYHACLTHAPATPAPPKPTSPPPPKPTTPGPTTGSHLPGSYTGSGDYDAVSFYVSPDGTRLQDVVVSYVYLGCSPGGSLRDHIGIAEIPVSAAGAFSATTK